MRPIHLELNHDAHPEYVRVAWDVYLESFGKPDRFAFGVVTRKRYWGEFQWTFCAVKEREVWLRSTHGGMSATARTYAARRVGATLIADWYGGAAQKTAKKREEARERVKLWFDRQNFRWARFRVADPEIERFLGGRCSIDDPTLWMVLADWLEERNYKQADLIRRAEYDPATSLYLLQQDMP